MLSWGEDCQRGFGSKGGNSRVDSSAADGVHRLDLGAPLRDRGLSAGRSVLAFVKANGNAFVIRTNESADGRRVRGKQKFVKSKEKFQALSCGDDVVVLLSVRGSVHVVDTSRHPFTPRPLDMLRNIPVRQVACGGQHSVALTNEGQVYTWGQDSRGQLGLGKRKWDANSPQHLASLSAIPLLQVAAGGEQSFALSASGGVFGWGRNDRGQLGLGDATDKHTPTPVKCLDWKKTVHISCGRDHTATVTKDGAVFTFGSGQHGQLGHNSFRDELRPRLVAELLGAKVTDVACGMLHTLVLTDSNKVYSFGCGEQGQLGHGGESHPSVPLPVQLPQGGGEGPRIRIIFAGGNCSFATCTSDEEESNTDGVGNGTQCRLDDMIDRWTAPRDPKSWKKTKQEIRRSFSSASCMNGSFLKQRKDKHFQTSTKNHGLNLSLARGAFKKLATRDDVLSEVEDAVLHWLPSFQTNPVGLEGLRIFLLLHELLRVMQSHKRQQSTLLAEAVAAAVLMLSAENLQVIGDWWTTLPASTMSKYVTVWKKALSVNLSSQPVPRNSRVRNLLQVLQYMYNANSRTAESRRMPDSDFHLAIDTEFLQEDLRFWISQSKAMIRDGFESGVDKPLILCGFPIVMDLQSKKMTFDMHADFTKRETMGPFWSLVYMGGGHLPEELLCRLHLRRASISEDTFEKLDAVCHSDYKRPLVVYLDGVSTHSFVYTKDLFHDVFHEMVSAESGMFLFNDSGTLAWFPARATQDHHRYFLFGVLCGLAFYNNCIIHLPFPMALFKKLLGVKPSLEDMMEFSPSIGKSLKATLDDYGDDDFKELDMRFSVSWGGTDVSLDPENPEKAVTSQNKKEFVEAYVNHAFNTSVENVFLGFKRGFFKVCHRDLVKLFRPKELQEILVGKDFIDWERLKQNTAYDAPYHPDHPNILMFWEVFDELTEDQKKSFLWFVTGFERVPVLKTKSIQMRVRAQQVEDNSDDQFYPETHTCYSFLDLPLYPTKEIMRTMLTEALSKRKGTRR